MTGAERQQRRNLERAARKARATADSLAAADPVRWAENIATCRHAAERFEAEAALLGQRRETPL